MQYSRLFDFVISHFMCSFFLPGDLSLYRCLQQVFANGNFFARGGGCENLEIGSRGEGGVGGSGGWGGGG